MSIPNLDPTDPSLYAICENIKPGGERCGSPAMLGQKYCYHHTDARKYVPKNNLFVRLWDLRPQEDPYFPYELPFPDDPTAIQIGFAQVIHAVSQERMPETRARLILSALHGASLNLRMMDKAAAARDKTSPAKKQPSAVKETRLKQGRSA